MRSLHSLEAIGIVQNILHMTALFEPFGPVESIDLDPKHVFLLSLLTEDWWIPFSEEDIDVLIILTSLGLVESDVAAECEDGFMFRFRRKQMPAA